MNQTICKTDVNRFLSRHLFDSNPAQGTLSSLALSWTVGYALEKEYDEGKRILEEWVEAEIGKESHYKDNLLEGLLENYIKLKKYKGRQHQAEGLLQVMEIQRDLLYNPDFKNIGL